MSDLFLPADSYFALRRHFAVELLRFISHCCSQFFFVAVQFQILWYTLRVPAGACSAKGHDALGHNLATGPGDDNLGIE